MFRLQRGTNTMKLLCQVCGTHAVKSLSNCNTRIDEIWLEDGVTPLVKLCEDCQILLVDAILNKVE